MTLNEIILWLFTCIYKISLRSPKCQIWGFVAQDSMHPPSCSPQLPTSTSPLLCTSIPT